MHFSAEVPLHAEGKTLESLTSINSEFLGSGTPKAFQFQYIDISSVSRGIINWSTVTSQTYSTAPSRARRIVRPRDILLCTVRPALQAHAFADWKGNENYICSTGFAVIRASDAIEPRYIYHLIFHPIVADQLRRLEIGSNYPAVNEIDIRQLIIPVPVIDEQHCIAQILDTIDTQIQESEKLIAKLKHVRIGLLDDLLMRGIDENGEVRDPVAHPEQFKESQLGRIPIGWTIGRLRDFYAEPARNGLYKAAKYYGKGNLMIHMPQMFRGLEVDISDAARVEVSVVEQERFKLKAGDLVFARRSLNLDGAGRCSLMPELTEPVTFESSIIRVRLSTAHLRPTFVNYFLNSDIGFRQRSPLIRQVAVSGVSSEDIASISVPCPPIEEQDAIINVSQTFDACISSEEANLNKLKQVKKGLMHDLLTGRVRVT